MATSNLSCGICFEYYKINEDILSSNCGHVFHNSCFKDWLTRSSTCPLCCTSNPQTHPIFLNVEDPSLAKRNLLKQLEESEQNFLSLQNSLTVVENKCTELENESQLQKAKMESYELKLSENKNDEENYIRLSEKIFEKDTEIERLNSLKNFIESKLADFKKQLLDFINDLDTTNFKLGEDGEDLNQNIFLKIKQLVDDFEIEELIEKFKNTTLCAE